MYDLEVRLQDWFFLLNHSQLHDIAWSWPLVVLSLYFVQCVGIVPFLDCEANHFSCTKRGINDFWTYFLAFSLPMQTLNTKVFSTALWTDKKILFRQLGFNFNDSVISQVLIIMAVCLNAVTEQQTSKFLKQRLTSTHSCKITST